MRNYRTEHTSAPIRQWIGLAVVSHYRRGQRQRGTLAVARQLRKQGFGLATALAILTRG